VLGVAVIKKPEFKIAKGLTDWYAAYSMPASIST
jgi:hypothetical protein